MHKTIFNICKYNIININVDFNEISELHFSAFLLFFVQKKTYLLLSLSYGSEKEPKGVIMVVSPILESRLSLNCNCK